jgi:hypothetical protein
MQYEEAWAIYNRKCGGLSLDSSTGARFDPDGHARFDWVGLYLLSSPVIERRQRLGFQERRK